MTPRTPAFLRRDPWLSAAWAAALLWAAVTVFLKLRQFASLNTQLYDVGESVNVLWNTFHGRPLWNGVMEVHQWSQHFSPAALLAGPAALWGGADGLNALQCLALASGVVAVFLLTRRVTGRSGLALGWAAVFALSPYVHEVNRVDFHEAGVGAAALLWMIAAWELGRRRVFWWAAGAALLCREDFGFYIAGFGLAVLASRENNGRGIASPWVLAAGGALWSLLVVFVAMPALAGGKEWLPAASSFGAEVSGPADVLRRYLHPDTWAAAGGAERALPLLRLLGLAGGLPLAAPAFAVSWALPVALNALSQKVWQYRFELHYSAAALPFLFWAGAQGLARLARWEEKAGRRGLLAAGLAVLAAVNAVGIHPYYVAVSAARREAARRMVRRIPPGDSVMAQTNLLAHVARRPRAAVVPAAGRFRWVFLDNALVVQALPELAAAQALFLERNGKFIVDEGEGLVLLHFPGVEDPG